MGTEAAPAAAHEARAVLSCLATWRRRGAGGSLSTMVHGPRDPLSGRRLEPRVHDPVEDRPFWDMELDMPAGRPHGLMIRALTPVLERVAQEAGLGFTSDNSAWYLDPATGVQKVIYPDILLARAGTDLDRLTADDALWVAEVVTTTERRKELKDTEGQHLWNEVNRVPEFALFFPDLDDGRSLVYHRLVNGKYVELPLSPGAEVHSETVPGLAFRVKPRAAWQQGDKIEVYFRGELRPCYEGLLQREEQQRARADHERKKARSAARRAARTKKQLETANQRADQQAERADLERQRAEQQAERADQAEVSAQHAADENERLRERLRALGLDPDV